MVLRLGAGVAALLAEDRAEPARAILWYEVSTGRAGVEVGSGQGSERSQEAMTAVTALLESLFL